MALALLGLYVTGSYPAMPARQLQDSLPCGTASASPASRSLHGKCRAPAWSRSDSRTHCRHARR